MVLGLNTAMSQESRVLTLVCHSSTVRPPLRPQLRPLSAPSSVIPCPDSFSFALMQLASNSPKQLLAKTNTGEKKLGGCGDAGLVSVPLLCSAAGWGEQRPLFPLFPGLE